MHFNTAVGKFVVAVTRQGGGSTAMNAQVKDGTNHAVSDRFQRSLVGSETMFYQLGENRFCEGNVSPALPSYFLSHALFWLVSRASLSAELARG